MTTYYADWHPVVLDSSIYMVSRNQSQSKDKIQDKEGYGICILDIFYNEIFSCSSEKNEITLRLSIIMYFSFLKILAQQSYSKNQSRNKVYVCMHVSWHLSHKRSSVLFSTSGFRPSREAPGILSSVRKIALKESSRKQLEEESESLRPL